MHRSPDDPYITILEKSEDFDREVLKETVPVLAVFIVQDEEADAEDIANCRSLRLNAELVAKAFPGKVKVVVIDVHACTGLNETYNVSAIPTAVGFKGGQKVGSVGFISNGRVLQAELRKLAGQPV